MTDSKEPKESWQTDGKLSHSLARSPLPFLVDLDLSCCHLLKSFTSALLFCIGYTYKWSLTRLVLAVALL